MALLGFSNSAGNIIGPTLSNFIQFDEDVDCSIVFYSIAILLLIQLFALALFRPDSRNIIRSPILLSRTNTLTKEAETFSDKISQNFSVTLLKEFRKYFLLLARREIYLDAVAVILSSISLSTIECIISDFIQTKFELEVRLTGFTLLAAYIPDVVASVFISILTDHYDNYFLILFGFFIHSLAAVMLGFLGEATIFTYIHSYVFFVFGLVFFYVSLSFISTTCMPLFALSLLEIQEKSSYAKIYAIYNICFSLGMILAPYFVEFVRFLGGSFLHIHLIFPTLTFLFLPFYTFQLFRMKKHRKTRVREILTDI